MGWVKFRMGDQAAAAEYLRRAYSTRPEADIAAHLAEVLWSQGKRDQAVELLRAPSSGPDQPRPARHDQAAGVAL